VGGTHSTLMGTFPMGPGFSGATVKGLLVSHTTDAEFCWYIVSWRCTHSCTLIRWLPAPGAGMTSVEFVFCWGTPSTVQVKPYAP
jgi:hypothetical protein